MELKYRAAVVGCGRMGAFTSESVERFAPRCWLPLSHAQAIRMHPELELAAFCDASPDALARAAASYGIERTYADYHDLFARERLDLVGIATRTMGRAEIVAGAVAAGVRALHVEKPLCNSMRELSDLADAFERPDLHVTFGAIRRHFAVYRTACELAASGRYGDLREIRVNMGRGMLYWTHPHSVDLILLAAGPRTVQAVQARLADVRPAAAAQIDSDPWVVSASIYFADGLAGHITQGAGYSLILSCSDAEIAVENDGQGITIAAPREGNPYASREVYEGDQDAEGARGTEGAQGTFAPIAQLVLCLDGNSEAVRLNSGLKQQIVLGQRVLFAMVQSHLEGSRLVGLGDVDSSMTILAKSGEKFA